VADTPSNTYDPNKAQAGWQATKAFIEALPSSGLKHRNADLSAAGQRAIHFATGVLTPPRRDVLRKLPAELFDAGQLDLLEHLGWVAAGAAIERQKALAQASNATLTPTLEQSSKERRARMIDLADYHLGEHPDHADEVADIISGHGLLDRAHDLARLADLYDAAKDIVAKDTKNYRANDASEARRESDAILAALSAGGAQLGFVDSERRIWTLLDRVYRDLRQTYEWAFRADPTRPEVPALNKSTSAKKPKSEDKPAGPGTTA